MKTVKKRFVFAVLTAVLSFTLFTGCDSPMGSFILPPDSRVPDNNTNTDNLVTKSEETILVPDVIPETTDDIPPGYGGVIINIGKPRSAARTVLPYFPTEDEVYYRLEFIFTQDGHTERDGWIAPSGNADGSLFFLFPVGNYKLEVFACNTENKSTSIAYTNPPVDFTVTDGNIENVSVQLEWYAPLPSPVIEPEPNLGTFRYDVSLLDTDDWLPALSSANMQIYGRDDSSIYRYRDFKQSGNSGTQYGPDKKIDSIQLPPGHYDLILSFCFYEGDEHNNVDYRYAYKRDIIHVYRNLVSSYTLTNLSYDNFTTFINGDVIVAASNPTAPDQMLIITGEVLHGDPWIDNRNIYLYEDDSVSLTAEILGGAEMSGGGYLGSFQWRVDTDPVPIHTGDTVTVSFDGVYAGATRVAEFSNDTDMYAITVLSQLNSAAFQINIHR